MNDLTALLDRLGHPRLLVLGDLILDRYTWGDADRVSPEAPVLILRAGDEEVRLGGAASVARLARGLGAQVLLAGVVGEDTEGDLLCDLLREEKIDDSAVIVDADRPTTVKERFVGRAAGRHPHQMLRVDRELRRPIPVVLEDRLLAAVLAMLEVSDAVLISDYAKGICTPRVVETVIKAANQRGLPVLVDPARGTDFRRYRGATLLKPNRHETELATGWMIHSPEDALHAGRKLCQECELAAVLITLDADGMALTDDEGPGEVFPTRPREVYDITGAGDMVLAMLGLCLAEGVFFERAAQLANVAAGLEVEKLGVAPVSRAELRAALSDSKPALHVVNGHIPDPRSKIVSLDDMAAVAEQYRAAGKKLVFTNGCFDLLHVGHVTCLQEAAVLGDVLIVAVNSDESVKRLKGPDRPIIRAEDRALLLTSLACVDHLLIFDDDTPHELLQRIRPDVLVKGGTTEEVVGREVVEAYGGTIQQTAQVAGVSATQILSAIQNGGPRKRQYLSATNGAAVAATCTH